jgi:hypothetical protein
VGLDKELPRTDYSDLPIGVCGSKESSPGSDSYWKAGAYANSTSTSSKTNSTNASPASASYWKTGSNSTSDDNGMDCVDVSVMRQNEGEKEVVMKVEIEKEVVREVIGGEKGGDSEAEKEVVYQSEEEKELEERNKSVEEMMSPAISQILAAMEVARVDELAKLTAMANIEDVVDLNCNDGHLGLGSTDSHPSLRPDINSHPNPHTDLNLDPKLNDESLVTRNDYISGNDNAQIVSDNVSNYEDDNDKTAATTTDHTAIISDSNSITTTTEWVNYLDCHTNGNSTHNNDIENSDAADDDGNIVTNLDNNNDNKVNVDIDINNVDISDIDPSREVFIKEHVLHNIDDKVDQISERNNKSSPLAASGVIALCGWSLTTAPDTPNTLKTTLTSLSTSLISSHPFSPMKPAKLPPSLYSLSSPFNRTSSPFKSSKTSMIKSNVKLNQELPTWIDSRRYSFSSSLCCHDVL